MRKIRLLYMIPPAAAIILEALPYGAVLNFSRISSEENVEFFSETYAYFSLTPFGYANFGPLITAVLSCLLLISALVYAFTGKAAWKNTSGCIALAAFIISLSPLLFGLSYYSAVGLAITVLLGSEAFLMIFAKNIL